MLKEFPVKKFGNDENFITPAGLDMFVGDDSKTLGKKCREFFCKFVEKGLFPCE